MKPFTKDKRTKLDKEIESVLENMRGIGQMTEDYRAMAEHLEILYKAKALEKSGGVSLDTIVVVAGNLLGIGLILSYERIHVVASKALGFVLRGRV